ncbi:MAG: hypothetical protein MZW92_12635 [Comamonadaceae bacterium]|nr:hypothetical protein [Comamonadaceae bacterium]
MIRRAGRDAARARSCATFVQGAAASRSSPAPSARTSTASACARSSTSSTAASRSGASRATYLGTSVPGRARCSTRPSSTRAQAILISTIITPRRRAPRATWRSSPTLPVEKGVRDKLVLIAGGTQVTDELAAELGHGRRLRPRHQGHRRRLVPRPSSRAKSDEP